VNDGHQSVLDVCPFCGEEEVRAILHYPTPPDEGCPYTPMTRSANTPAPPSVEDTERQGRLVADGSDHERAEGRKTADPATTL
jgi:hypothetical protein